MNEIAPGGSRFPRPIPRQHVSRKEYAKKRLQFAESLKENNETTKTDEMIGEFFRRIELEPTLVGTVQEAISEVYKNEQGSIFESELPLDYIQTIESGNFTMSIQDKKDSSQLVLTIEGDSKNKMVITNAALAKVYAKLETK